MRKDENQKYMLNLIGKTIQSVHKNVGYIIKFTDGSTLNVSATLRHEIPIVSFLPPLDEKSIKMRKKNILNQKEKNFLMDVLNSKESRELIE